MPMSRTTTASDSRKRAEGTDVSELDALCASSPSRFTDPRVVATAAVLWCVIIIVMYWWCGGMDTDTGYILWNFGPSEKLFFIGLHINTWERWAGFNAMILVDTVLNIWALEVIFTWITLEVYDRSKDDAGWSDVQFSDRTVTLIAVAYNFYITIHGLVWLYLALTSADTQLLIIVLSLSLTACIVRLYLRDKHRRVALATRKRLADSGGGDLESGRGGMGRRYEPARDNATLRDLAPKRSWDRKRAGGASDQELQPLV